MAGRVNIRRVAGATALTAALALAAFLAWKPPLLEGIGFSRAVFDRNGELLRLTLGQDETYRLFTPLKDISPRLRAAVLLHEDRHFYSHAGVNPVSLARAFLRTYVAGGRKVGASTVTMQLARIRYGMNTRSVPGKLWQIARALQLEVHYSKDQLLEAYLNLAPYGYNIEGAGAASFIYFRAKPQDLTLPEALALAVLPQSPARRRPDSADPAKPALMTARNRLFTRWLAEHPEDAAQKPFFSLPLAVHGIRDLPFGAPHLVQHLLGASKDARITASVDIETQEMLERLLRNYVRDRSESGINNASALLVDTRTMEAVASIGSADFSNPAISGRVDGTRARRSPGSALKPFIYALALDQGVIHPLSVLSDAPVSFGSYAPDNFERDFRGPLAARDALKLSRNIPALRLAASIHEPDLYDFLSRAGIGGLKDKKSYGLSLVLGGAEVTPRELAALYAMLANDGVLKPLSFRLPHKDDTTLWQKPLSPEAAFLTLDMLAEAPRPYAAGEPLKVYWKTGTSNGFRDAWAAGVFGPYALVVWAGNFNGKSDPALVGLHAAAPLFFSMVDALRGKETLRDRIAAKAAGLRLAKVEVCATTGDLSAAAEGCPVRDKTWFIPGVSPIASHDVYRKVLVDLKSGLRACRAAPGETAWRTFEVWPSDLRQTLQKAGINKPPLPRWQEGCDTNGGAAADKGQKPVILSPQPHVEYHARLDDDSEAVILNASADGDARVLNWFIDNAYLGTAHPGEPLPWKPQPGLHRVQVVDDLGRASATSLRVLLAQ